MARQNKLLLNIDQQTTNEEKAQGRANLGLATVAATGSYSDLSNKPTIPAAPVQSDWSVTDNQSLAYIKQIVATLFKKRILYLMERSGQFLQSK